MESLKLIKIENGINLQATYEDILYQTNIKSDCFVSDFIELEYLDEIIKESIGQSQSNQELSMTSVYNINSLDDTLEIKLEIKFQKPRMKCKTETHIFVLLKNDSQSEYEIEIIKLKKEMKKQNERIVELENRLDMIQYFDINVKYTKFCNSFPSYGFSGCIGQIHFNYTDYDILFNHPKMKKYQKYMVIDLHRKSAYFDFIKSSPNCNFIYESRIQLRKILKYIDHTTNMINEHYIKQKDDFKFSLHFICSYLDVLNEINFKGKKLLPPKRIQGVMDMSNFSEFSGCFINHPTNPNHVNEFNILHWLLNPPTYKDKVYWCDYIGFYKCE